MDARGCIFVLPLESESEEPVNSEEETLLVVDSVVPGKDNKEEPKTLPPQRQEKRQSAVDNSSPFYLLRFTWRMISWHILIFLVITISLYAAFHYGINAKNKKEIIDALTFLNDWRVLAFFFGIYLSFSVKKVSDISNNIPPTDKIANLVSIAVKNHKVQKATMKYVCTALAMVFSLLSPMVRKRLLSSEETQKARLERQTQKVISRIERKLLNVKSSHFMPIKWSLHVIQEARGRSEVDERLANPLIAELNTLHTQCDRLIGIRHETFAWGLTKGVLTVVYTYFVVGAIRQMYAGLAGGLSYKMLAASMTVNFLIFLCFLIILRCAEQIVQPYNEEHDVFELNRILNEKLEVAAFVLNNDCDLRKSITNVDWLP